MDRSRLGARRGRSFDGGRCAQCAWLAQPAPIEWGDCAERLEPARQHHPRCLRCNPHPGPNGLGCLAGAGFCARARTRLAVGVQPPGHARPTVRNIGQCHPRHRQTHAHAGHHGHGPPATQGFVSGHPSCAAGL